MASSGPSPFLSDTLHRISHEYIENVRAYVQDQEDLWQTDLTNLRQDISRLTVGINHHEAINKQMKNRLIQCNRDLANQRASKALRIRQIIRKWRSLTVLGDEMQVISSVVQRMHRARARSRALKSWWVYTLRASASRNRCKYEATLETMTADIITRYESELTALRSDVMSAHEIAAKEKVQRQQLEENMRRTLLQGITAMNVKTLQLLNTNCEGKVMGDENK